MRIDRLSQVYPHLRDSVSVVGGGVVEVGHIPHVGQREGVEGQRELWGVEVVDSGRKE